MPRVHNWEEWDEVEEQIQEEQVRKKIDVKNKSKQRMRISAKRSITIVPNVAGTEISSLTLK